MVDSDSPVIVMTVVIFRRASGMWTASSDCPLLRSRRGEFEGLEGLECTAKFVEISPDLGRSTGGKLRPCTRQKRCVHPVFSLARPGQVAVTMHPRHNSLRRVSFRLVAVREHYIPAKSAISRQNSSPQRNNLGTLAQLVQIVGPLHHHLASLRDVGRSVV